ncbi:ribbon-helix-helix domain-containing protein [Alphaproteobacteria bacterium]|jgi:predicted DNA-binding ribbon-helix-helix protein|nr:ribbon-helix-helix domain-containing protein [Alphaproteobacteria bacterium]
MTASLLQKKSFRLSGHATSVALEPLFWQQLKCIAENRGISVSALVKEEDLKMPGNLASSLRILVVQSLLPTS